MMFTDTMLCFDNVRQTLKIIANVPIEEFATTHLAYESARVKIETAARDVQAITAALAHASGDLVVLVGGTGGGRADCVAQALANAGTLIGHGIALLSHLLVADDISAGRLRVLMPAFPPARFPLTVVYPSRRNLPPRVRAVIEYLSEIVQADPAQRDDGAVPAVPHSEVPGPD